MEAVNVIDAVRAGRYKNTLEYPSRQLAESIDRENLTGRQVREAKEERDRRRREQRNAYHAEQARLVALFRADLEAEHGLAGHPKVDKLFSLAWDSGHACGLEEVANYYGELAELLA